MKYDFGDYAFKADAGLTLRGKPVHLSPIANRLLQLLLAAEGKVVGKEPVVAAIWGETAVADESISRAVYRLRLALQQAGGPDVIETIYGTGFRMLVPVRVVPRKIRRLPMRTVDPAIRVPSGH